MRNPATALAAALSLSMLPAIAAGAQSGVPLATVAARAGLAYRWLGPERSVSLSRPGLVVVLRPGETLYDVNDRVEIADRAPRYAGGDLVVDQSLAAHIERLARTTRSAQLRPPAATASSGPQRTYSGAIQIEARHLPGSEAIAVNGQAPPGAPVTITLLATLSPDIPTVLVSRSDVQTDVNGRFGAIISTAPDYLRGSTIEVLATSAPGVAPASAHVTLGAPEPGFH
ncbi:MAG: hypothetical protein ACYCUI_10665 [Vulcanimicrobiaceae bacterium]